MNRRAVRALTYVLVALQLLLSVPAASVWATQNSVHHASIAATPCDGMDMPSGMDAPAGEPHSRHCPGCPDDEKSARDCQAACAASVAMLPVFSYFCPTPVVVPSAEPLPVILHPLADPPLKPPPIA